MNPATSLHTSPMDSAHTPRGGNLAGATPVPAFFNSTEALDLHRVPCRIRLSRDAQSAASRGYYCAANCAIGKTRGGRRDPSEALVVFHWCFRPNSFEQAAQFLAQIGCGLRRAFSTPPIARARRDNSGLFHRESRPQIFLKIDHLTHVDGSLGCMKHHNRSAFA